MLESLHGRGTFRRVPFQELLEEADRVVGQLNVSCLVVDGFHNNLFNDHIGRLPVKRISAKYHQLYRRLVRIFFGGGHDDRLDQLRR